MLLNLSDVFSSQIKELRKDIDIEMDVFDDGIEKYDILKKTPVSFTFTNMMSFILLISFSFVSIILRFMFYHLIFCINYIILLLL